MKYLLAQEPIDIGEPLRGIGGLGLKDGAEGALGIFSGVISKAIGLMTIIAIIWFIFVFITGAIGIISSGGDKAALETSRKRITSGLLGLVVVVAAIFIIDFLGTLLNIPVLDIQTLFGLLPK